MTEDEMFGWHHWFNGHGFEQAVGDGEEQESLACCRPWGHKESDMTEQNNNKRGKEPNCQSRRRKRCGLDPWVGKIPWKRAWQPTPIFLPGESHGQRILVDQKESDRTGKTWHACAGGILKSFFLFLLFLTLFYLLVYLSNKLPRAEKNWAK